MQIRESDRDGVVVLHIVGNFELSQLEAFDARIADALESERLLVAVDAGEVAFLCSTSLASLIRAQIQLRERGGELAVARLPRFGQSVFEALGLNEKIACYETVDACVLALLQRSGGDAAR